MRVRRSRKSGVRRLLSEPQFLDCAAVPAQSKCYGSVYSSLLFPNCRLLSAVFRLSFWFACFLAIIGVAWRPPLASIGLIAIFLVLLVAVEWASRRLTAKKLLPPLSESETVQQRMTRTKTAEGLDRLDGTFWAEFPADTMTTTVHIPFCPAFESVPKVQVFSTDETDATDVSVRIVSPKMFGVRVDIKRNNLDIDRLCFTIIADSPLRCPCVFRD